jgi:hypothetical protein
MKGLKNSGLWRTRAHSRRPWKVIYASEKTDGKFIPVSTSEQRGMPLLASAFSHPQEQEKWDDSGVDAGRRASIRSLEPSTGAPKSALSWVTLSRSLVGLAANQRVKMALAACLVIVVGWVCLPRGRSHTHTHAKNRHRFNARTGAKVHGGEEVNRHLVESQVARISQM